MMASTAHGHEAAHASISEDDLTKAVLKSAGIRRPLSYYLLHPMSMLVLVTLGLTVYFLLALFSPGAPPTKASNADNAMLKPAESVPVQDKAARLLAALSAGGIFLAGYFQWHAARREQSLEHFYDKLTEVNRYINTYELEIWKNNPDKTKEHLLNMRVFSQLDNLEYILKKYRLGYVDYDVFDRAVRTFRAECKDQSFIQRVLQWVGRKDSEHQVEGTPEYVRNASRCIALNFEKKNGYHSLSQTAMASAPLKVEIIGNFPPSPG